jgi:hypothetical protein
VEKTERTEKTERKEQHRVKLGAASWFRAAFSVFSAFSVLSVAFSAPLLAQTRRAEGKVLEPDSTPVAGVRVVLHQVGKVRQGPIDSVNTDRRGRFAFAFRSDSASLYLLSARHAGIEYFSTPVPTRPDRPAADMRIVVYDTSSTTPVSVEARHLVLSRPAEDGSRRVLDLIVLRNDGQRTRVAPDSLRPSWSGPLPAGTLGIEVGESDVSPDAVTRRGDSVIVTAPLAPGEKQVTIEYLVPAGRQVLDLPFTQQVPMVNILAEEKDALVSGGTLALADSQVLQGRSFRRWTGIVPVGSSLRVTLPGRERAPEWLLAALVTTVVLVLGGAAWYLLKRPPVSAASSDELLEAVAALDARYLNREAETSADAWQFYQSERARLKALCETALAAKGRGP